MATHSTNITAVQPRSLRNWIDAFVVGFGQAFNAYAERRSRVDQIRVLEAKSDAELKAMGLRRDDIVMHVFRDMFYI